MHYIKQSETYKNSLDRLFVMLYNSIRSHIFILLYINLLKRKRCILMEESDSEVPLPPPYPVAGA